MEFRIVKQVNGTWSESRGNIEQLVPMMALQGHRVTGYESHPQRRAELQGLPVFEGLLGPMWDGNGVIRYENPEAYNTLST